MPEITLTIDGSDTAIARLPARLRASGYQVREERLKLVFGDIVLDRLNWAVTRGGEAIRLENMGFRALQLMMLQPGEPLYRSRMVEFFGKGSVESMKAVVKRLRLHLNEGGRPDPIRTVQGGNYVFEPDPQKWGSPPGDERFKRR